MLEIGLTFDASWHPSKNRDQDQCCSSTSEDFI